MDKVTLWISEADVTSAVHLGDAIAALAEGFAEEGRRRAIPMDKTMLTFRAGSSGGHGTLHALGAAFEEEQLVGTKTWSHTPGGADPVLLLWDAGTGALVAAIEAFALGQLRTAATAALATDRLARADAARLAVIGTGKQALAQVAAVCAVRPITEVLAFSRNADNRAAFATVVESELGVGCRPAASAAEAVGGADIVTLITRATEAVLTAAMVEPGVHINAVGAIDLNRREFEPGILSGCALVATDSLEQVQNLSSEFREFYGSDWSPVRLLGDLVDKGGTRSGASDVTLFKGMGSGIEDVALGRRVLAAAREAGAGAQVRRTGRSKPVLTGANLSESR